MLAQVLAVMIFVLMFGLIVSEKIERQWVSLGCGGLMLIVVEGMGKAGFFRWLCLRIAKAVRYREIPLTSSSVRPWGIPLGIL